MNEKRYDQDCDAHESGDQQDGKSASICSMPIQYVRSNQWPNGCASLVKCFVQAEYPPMSNAFAGVSQH